jgi:hypothetical protein
MTSTIEPVPDRIDQQQLAQQLVEAARAEGVELIGPGGLPSGLTKTEWAWTSLRAGCTEAAVRYGRPESLGCGGAVAVCGWASRSARA